MIFNYNFFGYNNVVWNTPNFADTIDEIELLQGTFDELYIDLAINDVDDSTVKPITFSDATVMDAKFDIDLSCTIDFVGIFKITHLHLYRKIVGESNWKLVEIFDYSESKTMYNFTDRYTQNGASYQYALVPVAYDALGGQLVSDVVESEFAGTFITDKENNMKLMYDTKIGEITSNTEIASNNAINGTYPIVNFSNTNYRSGTVTSMLLSRDTENMFGNGIDAKAEIINKERWLNFLNDFKPKVLRLDNGDIILATISNVVVTPPNEIWNLRHLANISFNFTEIGETDYETLSQYDLIPINRSNITYEGFEDEL